MNTHELDTIFENLNSKDNAIRLAAFEKVLALTEGKVEWTDSKWDELVEKLQSENSFQRSIGLMVLCNLAKSDTKNKMESILPTLLAHMNDEKFITSRQCIQNLWKVALSSEAARKAIVQALSDGFENNIHLSSHGNLIRQDIISSLSKIYQNKKDEKLMATIKGLIEKESNPKDQKVYIKIMDGGVGK